MKRRPNNHRSKHKDKRTQEGYKFRRQRSLREKRANKYGVSTLLDENPGNSAED